jgi:tetratricopeptide (TPR) repeat protein
VFRLFGKFASPERTPRELALEAIARGRFDEAIERLDALLEDPKPVPGDRAFYLNKRGVARISLGQTAAAREDFEAALLAMPRFAPAMANLGNLLIEAGDVPGAIAQYEAAIAADDDCAVAHFNLGVAYKRAGRVDEGVRAMRKAQRLEGRKAGKQSKRR